jgi:hypothetical protein
MSPRYIVYLILLISVLVFGIIQFRRLSGRFKILLYLLIIVLVSEISSRILVVKLETSLPTYHFLIPIQVVVYGLIYAYPYKNKTMTYLSFGICFLLCLFNTLFIQDIFDFPSYSLILLSTCLIISALLDFNRMLKVPTSIKLLSLPDFWFNLGTLLFYSMSFFVFSFLNEGIQFYPIIQLLYIVILNLFMYSSYGYSIYLDSRKKINA